MNLRQSRWPRLFLVGVLLLASAAGALARTRYGPEKRLFPKQRISRDHLLKVLDCLTREGLGPEFAGGQFLRMRYLYGVVDPAVDKPNLLHLIVYGVDGESAQTYEVFIEKKATVIGSLSET